MKLTYSTIIFSCLVISCGSNVVLFKDPDPGISAPDTSVVNNCNDNAKKLKYPECFDTEVKDHSFCHKKIGECMIKCSNQCNKGFIDNNCACQDYYQCYSECEFNCRGTEC